tara:strand:- start:259 stop:783 length:525 start_codon:yes stop_codon:yes gene_type:complete
MKKLKLALSILLLSYLGLSQSFHELEINSITGQEISMNDFKGKYILVVNVASKCGYTKQYKDLEKLSQLYENLIILGVPCNQFANQEPKSEQEIIKFCTNKYNVTFPMTQKVNVKGKNKHPLYSWLTEKSKNNLDDFRVSWNFNKFLISPKGELIKHYGSNTKPLSEKITSLLK